MDAYEPGLLLELFENRAKNADLRSHANSTGAIKADLTHKRGRVQCFSKRVTIEGFVDTDQTRVASDPPDRPNVVSFRNSVELSDGSSDSKHMCAETADGLSVDVFSEMGVRI